MAATRLAAFACAIWSLKVEEELGTFAGGCVRGVGLSARSLDFVLAGATVGLLTVEVLKPVRESVVLDAAAEGVPGMREAVVPFGTLELVSGFPMLLCCEAREVVCKGRGAATVVLCLEGVLFTAAESPDILFVAFALGKGRFAGDAGRADGFTKPPSLLPGRIVALKAEAGREGGPMGLGGGKKLDLLRSVTGVGGRRKMLSTVLSDRLGRDDFLTLGGVSAWDTERSSFSGKGLSVRKLCLEEARKPPREPS